MSDISKRKKALLSAITDEFIRSAKPVGSKIIVDNYDFDLSSATIRNEMKELEELGYITQPHTSAGRIPTTLGYQYYVDHFINKKEGLALNSAQEIDKIVQAIEDKSERMIKYLAKGMAELSSEAVLVRFGQHSFYYTGISNMFQKPEFCDARVMYSLSELIDHLDDAMSNIVVKDEVEVLIGEDNPISSMCSTLISEYFINSDMHGLIAILGPQRMNYQLNYKLIKYVKDNLNKN